MITSFCWLQPDKYINNIIMATIFLKLQEDYQRICLTALVKGCCWLKDISILRKQYSSINFLKALLTD